MRFWGSLVVIALVASGCFSDPGSTVSSGVPVAKMEAAIFPGDRPIANSVTWHEEPHDATDTLPDGFTIENKREPRDVNLTYHGIQPVLDEWARAVPAHVFRYRPMELQVTSVEVTANFDFQITARWEEGLMEYAFDAADGHLMGYLDLKHEVRTFSDGRYPEPWIGGYEGDLLLPMAYLFLDGDLSRGHPNAFQTTYLNETEDRPLDGDCTPHEYEYVNHPWYQAYIDSFQGPASSTPQLDPPRHIVCLQDEGRPLWVYMGNATDRLELTRISRPMSTPALEGELLPPVEMERRATDPLDLLLPLGGPVNVPPVGHPGDWSDQIRPVVQGVATNLDYQEWALNREHLFLGSIVKAFPYFDLPTLPLLPENPLRYEWTSWVWVSDGPGMYWADVNSHYGGPEDPDIHFSDRGTVFDDFPFEESETVPPGNVQNEWGSLAPLEPMVIDYSNYIGLFGEEVPQEMQDYLEPFLHTWHGFEYCFVNEEGGQFAQFSAVNGQMLVLANQTSYGISTGDSFSGGCYTGVEGDDGFARANWGAQDILFRPANGDAPGFIIVPETGEVFAFGRPAEAAFLSPALHPT